MSAAEQLEDVRNAPPPRDALLDEEAFIETQLTESPARTRARLRPLLALAP
jgi:ATP-binding cassette subfamily B protein